MPDIICQRGEATHPAHDIIEPLLATVGACLSRGRAELDDGALSDSIQLTIALTDVRLGKTVRVDDPLGIWQGKIVGVSHTVQVDDEGNISGETQIKVTRPT